ncbi:unnamed protein product [Closterium sp. Naga37s-1]|nr:unnamed protein product [Closterium sp. Naga37s-1]
MNVIATNDMDEIYEDPEYAEMGKFKELSVEDDESEGLDDTAASVEAAVKLEEEIVTMEVAAVNGGDGDDVNTFAAVIVVEDEAVNAKCVGVEAVKGDIMVKGSKVNATAKGRVLTKEEHVEGYETRDVLGVKARISIPLPALTSLIPFPHLSNPSPHLNTPYPHLSLPQSLPVRSPRLSLPSAQPPPVRPPSHLPVHALTPHLPTSLRTHLAAPGHEVQATTGQNQQNVILVCYHAVAARGERGGGGERGGDTERKGGTG